MDNTLNHNQYHRVVTMLNRDEIDFLDKLCKDAQFAGGHRLSRTEILRTLVDALRDLNIKAEDITSHQALAKKIFENLEHKTGRQS